MWLSTLCSKWCERLKDNDQDLRYLILRETSPGSVLAQVNWRSETLMDFLSFMSKVKFEFYDDSGSFYEIICDECGIFSDIILDQHVTLIEPWWEELKYRIKTEECICSLLPSKCACGISMDCWAIKYYKTEDVYSDAYSDAYNYSLCRFCQKVYSEKSREADQATPGTNFINSDGTYNENMTKSWMRSGQVLESLRLFHLQNGKWNGHYHPGQYYCSPCLVLREQIYLDLTASAAESRG
jgi:hypothetical protein